MELRSGRIKSMTKSINDVPNEILDMILLKLPTQDLLRCRSVSKSWKSFATATCRRRHVTANLRWMFHNTERTEGFHDTFQDTSDLPWSACSLEVLKHQRPPGGCLCCKGPDEPYSVSRKQLRRFADAFGPNLRKLKLSGDNLYTIVPALTEMPNLEFLTTNIKPVDKDLRMTCSANRLQFNKLKRLEIIVRCKADIQLMEFICKNSSAMEAILLKFRFYYNSNGEIQSLGQADLNQIVALIGSIPSISLNLASIGTADLFKMLTVPELRITELEFESSDEAAEMNGNYYRALEQFLGNNSHGLEKLVIGDSVYATGRGAGGPLRLPTFSKLKEMELYCNYISTSFLHPFMSNQFPVLKEVMIEIPPEVQNIGQFTTVFATAQFESVKELTLDNSLYEHSNPMITDWAHIFPNLLNLTLCGVTEESHPYIYLKMTKLEHLKFTVSSKMVDISSSSVEFPGDVDTILVGYPKNGNKKNRDETAQTRSLQSLTSTQIIP